MPQVSPFLIVAPCAIVISLPALLCHAVLRNYWLANAVIWLLSFGAGFSVAHAWNFPDDHFKFGLIASLIGLATGMLLGIPFVLYRRGWIARFWTHLTDQDLPTDALDLASQVARLKEVDRRRRQRAACMLALWFLAGIVAAFATWIAQEPVDRDSGTFRGVLALGLGILFGGILVTRLLFPQPNIYCPRCGHYWAGKIASSAWLTWKSCPGCGMRLEAGHD